jgi:hypothetical protein
LILALVGCAGTEVRQRQICTVLLVKKVSKDSETYWKAVCDPDKKVIRFQSQVDQGEVIEYSPYYLGDDNRTIYAYVRRKQ